MRTVPLHGLKAAGRVALVDDADYDLVMQYRWRIWERTRKGNRDGPYAVAHAKRDGKWTTIKMHSLIMGCAGPDHRDGDGLNNQRENLRVATQAENVHNQRPHRIATSPYKGVSWASDRRKWIVVIMVNGRLRNLGRFTSEVDAARAYDAAAHAAWGEFAYLNFPDIQR